jgi:hypothetical protein
LIVAAALVGGAASATAATQLVANGGFETGTLEGWTTTDQGNGANDWFAYNRKAAEEASPGFLALPPVGEWAAATFNLEEADTTYLYQDLAIPAASSDQLSMYLYYASTEPIAVPSPNTLAVSGSVTAQPNQQVRVDVLKPNAPIESLSPNDILTTVYASKPGDPEALQPTLLTADLSAFAGQTVRLRIADVAQDGMMIAGVDGVSIDSTPLPVPQPEPSPATKLPSNAFSTGRLVRDRKHGGAKLDVTLPGPGRLTVTDARRKVAIASALVKPHQLPILIRTASVQTTGPQTVRVFLRPTPAAKKLLAKGGKLPFRLQLTFSPEGGMAATQGYAGTLVKTIRPARR